MAVTFKSRSNEITMYNFYHIFVKEGRIAGHLNSAKYGIMHTFTDT